MKYNYRFNSFRSVLVGGLAACVCTLGYADDSLFVNSTGDVGVGTSTPVRKLDVTIDQAGFPAAFIVQNISNDSNFVGFRFATSQNIIDFNNGGNQFRLNFSDGDTQELSLDADGNLRIDGTLTVNADGSSTMFPDYVFQSDYELMPLKEVASYIEKNSRLPKMPSAEEVQRDGLDMTQIQINLVEKVEELTLYTISQQKLIDELTERLTEIEKKETNN